MRTTKKILGFAAGVALAGCTHADNSQAQMPTAGRQVSEAQQEAADAYARAEQAQREAQNKADAATRAENEALRKQREAEQARRDAVRARQDAEQAQQEAMIVGRDAERRAATAQQRAISEQPSAERQNETLAPVQTVTGRVRSTSNDSIVIERQNAPDLILRVDPNTTQVMRNGQQGQPSDVQQGQQVTVSYRVVRDQPVAQIVQAGAMPTSQDPNEPQPE